MRLVPEIIRRAIAFYRKHGFWALMKAGVAYLWNAYQVKRYHYPLSLKAKPVGQGMRIFYIDYFSPRNSNLYWLKAFQKFGKVKTFDIVRENKELLKDRIMDFRPVHIHLGGSVKDSMVSPQLLANIKSGLKCTISVFYGDCEYSPYHCELAESAEYIYISNRTHIKVNEEKGHQNFRYMPCPTAPEIFNYRKYPKRYDLVFIGNNNQPERLPLLKSLAGSFDLKVFGSGWEKTGLNYSRPVYGARFSHTCNRAKICLAIVEPKYANLEAYFSNRLVNTLATRSFCIQTYTPGLEGVFTNHKHLVWHTSKEELFQLIEYYLGNEEERERIATEGQKEVYQKYTYETSVERILSDAKAIKPLKLHLGCGSKYLDNYVNIDIQDWASICDLVADATNLHMFEDNSIEHIFTHALLEHIPPWDTIKALKEWNRVLRPGGTIQIEVPDLERVFKDWLINNTLEEQEAINNIYGGNKSPDKAYSHQDHLTGFTYNRLTRMMADCGFTNFERPEHPKYHHLLVVLAQKVKDGDILLRAKKAKSNILDEDWQNALSNEMAKGGKRFTIDWYRNHTITKELLESSILKGKIIELGCGIGTRAFLAQEKSDAKITGIDASQYAIDYAINNFSSPSLDFLCGDLTKMPFEDGTFDNAYMLAVVEHVADTDALLSEIKRVVKPGGKLFLSVTEKDYHSDPSHVHIFTAKSLKDALEGFKLLNLYVKEHIIFATVEI